MEASHVERVSCQHMPWDTLVIGFYPYFNYLIIRVNYLDLHLIQKNCKKIENYG